MLWSWHLGGGPTRRFSLEQRFNEFIDHRSFEVHLHVGVAMPFKEMLLQCCA